MKPIIYLAPLHGVTNYIFRNAYIRFFSGIDFAMAPFINSINSETAYAKSRGNHFKDLLPEYNTKISIIPQILGNEAKSFIETAETLEGYGYKEVNWNLGCPFPMVTNKKRGSGLLPYPELIENFLQKIYSKVKIDISLKVRLGLDDPKQLLTLVPVFNKFPLKKIIIHPRIGTQMYEGTVDLDSFTEAASLLKHKVMYNGDIRNAKTFDMLQKKFPEIDEWMIGRWAVYNPFLPSLLKGNAPGGDPKMTIKAFHDYLYFQYREVLFGPKHILDKMKEIWTYLGRSFSDAERALKDITRSKTIEDYEKAVDLIFSKSEWKP